MFTQERLVEIASLPESAFRYKCHVEALMTLYQWVREQWTKKAVTEHRHKYNLNCRTTEGKLKFALFAAKEMSQDCLPGTVSEVIPEPVNNQNKETQTSKILCQAIAFLKPVPKTNGLEKSPTYQVMGEPIYWDELVRNYKQLVVKWHPDNNPSVEAVGRIQLITQIYQELKTNWMTKYSPLIPLSRIGEDNLQRAMSQKLPWTPKSFWV